MNKCCHEEQPQVKKSKTDFLLWGSLAVIVPAYFISLLFPEALSEIAKASMFSESIFALMNKMWWGVLLGMLFVGLLDRVPREFVISILGRKRGLGGVLRATFAGVCLDLCSHGILFVGMKLYERGASLGQTMAFLIASPWNSFSLTLILWALVGFKWMITFLLLSAVIAIISGVVFEILVKRGVLSDNPNSVDIPDNFKFFPEVKKQFKDARFDKEFAFNVFRGGVSGSKMILRWILFGVVLASLIRTFVPMEVFQNLFGPTLIGLGLTLLAATIIEVCSEGSTPVAADLINIAGAPGNSFAFLMTGVSTDYTEIMVLKDTTKSWKIALFLPLITVPQVVLLGLILNSIGM